MRVTAIVSALLLLAGCAYTLNKQQALDFADSAFAAEQSRQWWFVELQFRRALGRIEVGDGPPDDLSWAEYNLGRGCGYVCKFDEAKQRLERALALEESSPKGTDRNRSMRLGELARLHYDRALYAESLPYFERALTTARAAGAISAEPLSVADALDEYAHAQREAGLGDRGAAASAEALELRAASPDTTNRYVPIRYSLACSQHSYPSDWAGTAKLLGILRANSAAGHPPDGPHGYYLLEYGRALGVGCRYDEAESVLRESQALLDRADRAGFLAAIQLGKISLARQRHAEAVERFEQVLPALDADPAHVEPMLHAQVLADLATALDALKEADRAAAARARSQRLSGGALQKNIGWETPYGKQCPG